MWEVIKENKALLLFSIVVILLGSYALVAYYKAGLY